MADAMSPNPSPGLRQRAPMTSRLQSATSPFFLGSHDDQLERAQARASRAAAIHRNSIAVTAPPPPAAPCLCNEQIVELFKNCIKLASENLRSCSLLNSYFVFNSKINQKNTSELNLIVIDHLSEIIKVEAEDDAETNFQKASCKLESGVKIYSLRVDSMHSEAYKVLGGINRAGREDEHEAILEADNGSVEQDKGCSKKEERKMSPLATLESSLVAFAVDPLYHQISAQFEKKTIPSINAEVDVDLTKSLDREMLEIFAPPENPKLLLLSPNRAPSNITLPEDCHYQPEDLVKLFLLPHVMCLAKRGRKASGS